MSLDIGLISLASALASHAFQRQGLIAQNIANADTPGFRAQDLRPFADALADTGGAKSMRATRSEHYGQRAGALGFEVMETAAFGAEAPNGNTVSLEDQMMRSASLKADHDLALGVYRKSLDILRLGLGRRG